MNFFSGGLDQSGPPLCIGLGVEDEEGLNISPKRMHHKADLYAYALFPPSALLDQPFYCIL